MALVTLIALLIIGAAIWLWAQISVNQNELTGAMGSLAAEANAENRDRVLTLQSRLGQLYRQLGWVGGLILLGLAGGLFYNYRSSRQLSTTLGRLDEQARQTQEARELLIEAIDTSPDGFIVYDETDKIVLRNDAVDRVYGRFAPAIQVGNRFEDIVRQGLAKGLYRDVNDQPAAQAQFIEKRRQIHLAGNAAFMYHGTDDRWVRVIERRSKSGYIVSVATDITEIKATEQALLSSESRYRGILEDHHEFILRSRPDLTITYVNPAYTRHLGCTEEQLLSQGVSALFSPDELSQYARGLTRLTQESPSMTRERLAKDAKGHEQWESWTTRALYDEDAKVMEYQSIGRDITAEKLATAALETSARQFRSIAEAHPIPVLLGRIKDNAIVYANQASVPLLGDSLESILRRKGNDYFGDPDTQRRFETEMVSRRAVDNFPAVIRNTEGRTFKAELTARLCSYDSDEVIAVSVVDTTERQAAAEEISRQRQALAQSEKLSALGSLLASVSHELNNPLAIVVGQSQLLEATAPNDETRDRAQKISTAAKRSARIVKTFLSMVRQRAPSRTQVDLNDVVGKSLEMAGYGLRDAGVELVLELSDSLPCLKADEDQLIQVAVNLMINAQQALESHSGEKKLIVTTSRLNERTVQLAVADSGPGIAPDAKNKVFDAFFTTKAEGLGTGIGLSVSNNIVRAHGGNLRANDSEMGGALFTVDLPVAGVADDDSSASADLATQATATGRRVLVVDDEPEIAATIQEILELDGYESVSVTSGEAALESLTRDSFDLVISDLRMPEMNGPALYRQIKERQLHPFGQIAFLTGDGLSSNLQEFVQETGQPVIEKPFQPEELLSVVREMIEASIAQHI